MSKYQQMKSYKGDSYKIMVNVVNDTFADFLTKRYGLKKIEDNGHGGVIMTNESDTPKSKITFHHFVDDDRMIINGFVGRTNIGNVILQVHNNGYSNFEDVMDELEYKKLFGTNKFVEIDQLRVSNDFRGSGYAKELMFEALNTIKKQGFSVAYLNASPLGRGGLNLPELISLYKKFGFIEIQHDLNYGDDNREMILHL
jgi:ribosomal protein S18 acetylase RimI-like enzyme